MKERLEDSVLESVRSRFQEVLGGQADLWVTPETRKIGVRLRKAINLPGGVVQRVDLMLYYPPEEMPLLSAPSTDLKDLQAREVRLEVSQPRRFWGISSCFCPLSNELRLHFVYREDGPLCHPGWDDLWEEANVHIGGNGQVQLSRVIGLLAKGSGRNLQEQEVDSLVCFQREGSVGVDIKSGSFLGRMAEELNLPLTFREGESGNLGSARKAASTIVQRFFEAFQRIPFSSGRRE